ncbi:M67 family peptidase [Thermococcus sp. GR7]|uniref:M67 family metallopeptidase n=1 Tax=unclassified Thermococcus TaxID=2627626 RepID=UPI001430CC43|nr:MULTISPECIES: M67 family metallopeptidase [unclassified Thermococcus]NJE47449.1 M67 family peptidase [Thermococcus sp. GR7]NJE79254.1 M67 family peptidase [Thermococcus sp. GR4]NJF23499.1 M67 family peptidase [Thermococcus sp. GR5]
MKLTIRQEDLNRIIKAAKKSGIEICGFLFGRKNCESAIVKDIRFITNRIGSPTAFEMEPLEMVQAIDEAEKRGLEVVGIFHSHLKCPPRPSGHDLPGMRLWPVVWLIVDDNGNYRAFVLEGEKVREVPVEIVSSITDQWQRGSKKGEC